MRKVIFKILLLIILWLVYRFAILRYISINLNPLKNSYIDKYQKLPRANKAKKVIISFTTIPSRIETSKYMLSSILDQSVRVDEVRLYIPTETRSGKRYEIPTWMQTLQKTWPEFSIKICDKDWGPATKIIPALLDEKETDNFIIYLDDDMVYHKQVVEKLVDASNRNYNKAICNISGKNKVICGFAGCLVRPRFFDLEKIILTDNYPPEIFFEDDVYISGMLVENKTKIFCTNFSYHIPYFYEFIIGYILRISKNSLSSTVNKDRKNFQKAYACFKWD